MTIHEEIITLLEKNHAIYRVCEHQAEGRSEQIAAIRGNQPCQAMKAIVIMAKHSKKDRKYYLAIIPGDKMLDLEAIKEYSGAAKVIFAPREIAKELSGCEIGAIPPFTFNPELSLLVDPAVKNNTEIVFNAGLLTKSIFMNLTDYIAIVQPALVPIAK